MRCTPYPFAAILLAAAVPLAAQDGTRVSVGEKVPDITFEKMASGDGRTKLSEFHGQPVLIELWGHH